MDVLTCIWPGCESPAHSFLHWSGYWRLGRWHYVESPIIGRWIMPYPKEARIPICGGHRARAARGGYF